MKINAHIALIAANALLGANFSFYASLYAEGIGYAEIFLVQILSAMLVFAPLAATQPPRHRLTIEDFGTLFTIALIVVFGWLYLLTKGASLTNPIDASTLSTIGPIVTLFIAYAVKSEPTNRLHVVGTTIALMGAVTMLADRQATFVGSDATYSGDILVAISVVAAAIHATLSKRQTRRYGPLCVIGYYFTLGTALALPILWGDFTKLLHRHLTADIASEILYVALLGTALPLWLIYSATRYVTPTSAATYRYVQPLVAITLAIVRGQTTLDDITLLGMILIVFGVILLGIATERRSATIG